MASNQRTRAWIKALEDRKIDLEKELTTVSQEIAPEKSATGQAFLEVLLHDEAQTRENEGKKTEPNEAQSTLFLRKSRSLERTKKEKELAIVKELLEGYVPKKCDDDGAAGPSQKK